MIGVGQNEYGQQLVSTWGQKYIYIPSDNTKDNLYGTTLTIVDQKGMFMNKNEVLSIKKGLITDNNQSKYNDLVKIYKYLLEY